MTLALQDFNRPPASFWAASPGVSFGGGCENAGDRGYVPWKADTACIVQTDAAGLQTRAQHHSPLQDFSQQAARQGDKYQEGEFFKKSSS